MKEKLRYISNNLKSYRARMGYSQDKMAELLNISRATYCDYEVNPQKVKIETYTKIAEVLNCNLADFFIQNNVTFSNINNSQILEE